MDYMSSKKTKLLVVSSYRRPCGIAQYLEHLEIPLREQAFFDVEIAALPVDLLRANARHAQAVSRRVIEEIAKKAREADVVNIQLEPGLFGLTPKKIWERLDSVLGASRKVILTYHTVPPTQVEYFDFTLSGLRRAVQIWRSNYVFKRLYARILTKPKKFFHIVQTSREAKNLEMIGFPKENIGHHPLAFLNQDQQLRFSEQREQNRKLIKSEYSISGKILGCFGFLSSYKGIEIAIRAMNYLPEDYHLLIVGGLHPEGIERGKAEQPYIKKLMAEIEKEDYESRLKSLLAGGAETVTPRVGKKSEDLVSRIHFCGSPDNEEFNRIMSSCDAVLLPYAEVGQTSSGPAAIALDMLLPTHCARTHCFRELDKYEPGILSFFEIGNYIELAEKIRLGDGEKPSRVKARSRYLEKNNVYTRAALYLKAFEQLQRG
jgi:glycosyltransferase involved in cell wall biosynthesis